MNLQTRVAKRALLGLLLLLAFSVLPASAQEPPDTVSFEVFGWGLVGTVAHDCPIRNDRVNLYEGATLRCPVWVVDSEGQRTLGRIVIEVADTTFLTAEIENDTILVLHQKRKGGNTHVRMFPVPILMVGAFYPDGGEMDWSMPLAIPAQWDLDTMEITWQATTVLCGYVNGRDEPQAKTDPRCPDLVDAVLPIFPVQWSVTEEYAYPQTLLPRVALSLIDGAR